MPLFWFTLLVLGFTAGLALGRWRQRGNARHKTEHEPSREQLLSWLDQAPLGWLIVDQTDRLRFLNARAQRLLEIPTTERPPLRLSELDGVTTLQELVNTVREHRQSQRMEWDCHQQQLEVFAFAGQSESVAIILQSRRSLEAQLHQQERWVSDVAHELKTPLTALLLVADSLAATVNDRNVILVERLLKELRRMQDLVGDLLELSRLENVLPGQALGLDRVPIAPLLKDAWQGVKPLADAKQVGFFMPNDAALDETISVLGDRKRLHRAFLNLFDNALRYSPEGGSITIDLHTSADWLRIGILDEGPGLSEQDLEHMFERFYRGDASRFRYQRAGSGLGLAIVQQIVLTHGGWIYGENALRGGARFEVRLPLGSAL